MANCIPSKLNILEFEAICTPSNMHYWPEASRPEFRKGWIVKNAELEGWQFYSDANMNVYELPEFIESKKSAIEFIKAADKWYLIGLKVGSGTQN